MKKALVDHFSADFKKNPEELATYLDLALESANLGIWDWYLDDNSVKFDRRWAKMIGLDHNKIKMELETWQSRVHPQDIEQCYADIKAYMDGKIDYYENVHRIKHTNGHWVHILDRGRFSGWDENGKPIRFTGIRCDITNIEQNLKKNLLLFNQTELGFAFCDMNGNLLDANNAFEKITGYTIEEIKKLSYWDITPRKYKADEAVQLESLKKNGSYGPYRKEYVNKDGRLVPVELRGFIVEDYDGVTGIWSTIRDLSETRDLESQLNRKSKLASIGVLSAGLAHEINNPLAIIKGYFEKLRVDYSGDEKFQEVGGKIDCAIERIAKIVASLRNFSHDDQSGVKSFNIFRVISEVSDEARILYETEVLLELDIDSEESFLIKGVDGKIHQAFLNILDNAKAATAGKDSRKVSIRTKIDQDDLSIWIRDNGHGISEENLIKVFDPFFSTKDVNEGIGIGLYITHNLIVEFGGVISVSSKLGEWSEFKVELKRTGFTENSSDPINDRSPKIDISSSGGKVILVDDEPDIADLLTAMLGKMGLDVEYYPCGETALNAFTADQGKYDLIVSDLRMPKMTGLELFGHVRKLDPERETRFIAITGGVHLESKQIADIDGVLYKPFDYKDFVEMTNRVLGEKVGVKKGS